MQRDNAPDVSLLAESFSKIPVVDVISNGGDGSPTAVPLVASPSSTSAVFGSSPSAVFGSAANRQPRRRRTNTLVQRAQTMATEEFRRELKHDIGHNSSDDDDMRLEQKIADHKEVLQRSSTRHHVNDAIRSREQSDLHKMVNSLQDEVKSLTAKFQEESRLRQQAASNLQEVRKDKEALEGAIDDKDAEITRLQLRVGQLETENQELSLMSPSASPLNVSIRKGGAGSGDFTRAASLRDLKRNKKALQSQQLETLAWAETRVRDAIEAEAMALYAFIGTFTARTSTGSRTSSPRRARVQQVHVSTTDLSGDMTYQSMANDRAMLLALEGMRRNAVILDESNALQKLMTMALRLQEQHEMELASHRIHLPQPSHRSPSATRRLLPKPQDLTPRPFYPAGTDSSQNYHKRSPGRTPIQSRSGTPVRTNAHNTSTGSPQVSRSSSTQYAHASGGSYGNGMTPVRKSPSPHPSAPPVPTPRSAPPGSGGQNRASPPHLTRTMENMQALLHELEQWEAPPEDNTTF